MANHFPKLVIDNKPKAHESQRMLSKMNTKDETKEKQNA